MVAADRTIRVLAQLQFAKAHAPRVEQKKPVNHDVRRAQNDLDRFVRLDRADDSRQPPEPTAVRGRWPQARRWWFRMEAPMARAALGRKTAGLSFEAKDRAVDVGL